MEHTPGPWHAREAYLDGVFVVASADSTIAIILQGRHYAGPPANDAAANANLIAASPEMLRSLVAVVAMLEHVAAGPASKLWRDSLMRREAMDAIAKARGSDMRNSRSGDL